MKVKNLLDAIILYKESKDKLEEQNKKKEKISPLNDHIDRVNFYLTWSARSPSMEIGKIDFNRTRTDEVLINLDEDDIQYFMKKYLSKLSEERYSQKKIIDNQYEYTYYGVKDLFGVEED